MSSSRRRKSLPPASSDAPWELLIGEITAPHGLKGEVRVFPHTDDPERFYDLTEVGLRTGAAGPVRVVPITQARVVGKRVWLKLAGVDSIEAAEALRGTQLVIPQAWARPLEDDEYYHHQLLGLEVVTTDGESLGKITEIWQPGANDVYETPLALIPAVKEFIREIDLDHGRMVVEARPGLRKSDPGE